MQNEFLRVAYAMDRLLWQDPDRDQLDVWRVSLQTSQVSTDASGDVHWETVAWAMLYAMDVDRWVAVGQDPFDVADADSADAAYYYSHVFDARGELLADVVEQFEWPPNRVLVLDDVRVEAPFRRQGYGSLVVADALLTLATHGTAVFAHPGPTDLGSEGEDDDVPFAFGRRRRTPASSEHSGLFRSATVCGCLIWRLRTQWTGWRESGGEARTDGR